jgi:hemerythrin-like domain-containing protein
LRLAPVTTSIDRMKRSRALKPLSSEHHQALLVAFQLKKGVAGHAEAAGAPKDLPGLLALARRYEEQVLRTHMRAEEDLLARFISADDMARLRAEHAELSRLLEGARTARQAELRAKLGGFADLIERHVRWEERELFPYAEGHADEATLAAVGGELEKRLVMGRSDARSARR